MVRSGARRAISGNLKIGPSKVRAPAEQTKIRDPLPQTLF